MQQGRADALATVRRIDEHHRDPRHRLGDVCRLAFAVCGGIAHRRHGTHHESGVIGCHRRATRGQREELLPVARDLVPVTQPAEP